MSSHTTAMMSRNRGSIHNDHNSRYQRFGGIQTIHNVDIS